MNLLFLIHSMSSGGAERVTANLANHWAEKGFSITIVTLAPQTKDFYDLHPTIKRITLDLAVDSKNIFNALINNGKRVFAIRQVLKQIKPQVAIGIMTSANVYLALARWRLSSIKVIGSEHVHPPQSSLGLFWEWLRHTSYRSLDHLTVLTAETQQWATQHVSAKKIAVIPNAIPYPLPIQDPVLTPQNYLNSQRHYLIAVGRLSEQKGFDYLIRAFQTISQLYLDWDLVIMGEGELRQVLEKQIANQNLEKRILMLGRVGNVGDWYAAADIYVMSSRYEGFGNTLAEAMAYGIPAISFDCDTGPRDIIRHGIDGLLVAPNDIAALVQAIKQLIEDESMRQKMSQQAIEVRRRFSMEKVIKQWEALF